MNQLQFFRALAMSNDEQVQKMLRQKTNVDISMSEIKKLRPVLANAQFNWLVQGLPRDVKNQIDAIIGKERRRKLINTLL